MLCVDNIKKQTDPAQSVRGRHIGQPGVGRGREEDQAAEDARAERRPARDAAVAFAHLSEVSQPAADDLAQEGHQRLRVAQDTRELHEAVPRERHRLRRRDRLRRHWRRERPGRQAHQAHRLVARPLESQRKAAATQGNALVSLQDK